MIPFSPEHIAAIGASVIAAGIIIRSCLRRHRKWQAVKSAVAERKRNDRAAHIVIASRTSETARR